MNWHWSIQWTHTTTPTTKIDVKSTTQKKRNTVRHTKQTHTHTHIIYYIYIYIYIYYIRLSKKKEEDWNNFWDEGRKEKNQQSKMNTHLIESIIYMRKGYRTWFNECRVSNDSIDFLFKCLSLRFIFEHEKLLFYVNKNQWINFMLVIG